MGGNANDRLRLSCQVSTSLTYIVPLTRGCSPWRPACGYGYDLRRESTLVPRIFQGPASGQCSTGRSSRRSALRGRGAYLQSSRFQAKRRGAPPLCSGILTRFPFCTLSWLIINLIDSGYFKHVKTYIYLNTHLCM